MAKNRETRTVAHPALLAVGQRSDVLVWRQQSGVFRRMDDPESLVRVGVAGMSDAGMIVAVTITPDMVGKTVGVCVQPEFKTATGRQAEAQANWQEAVQQRGGVYRLVRSAEDMVQLVEDVQHGRAW